MIPKLKIFCLAACAIVAVAILAGCNDTLRQFIITVPKPGGTPASQANAVVLSTNPAGNGSTLHLDVSGDDIAAIVPLGVNPLFLGKEGATAVVVNGDNTVSSYLALLALSATVHTSVLPAAVSGAIAGGTSSSGNFFITDMGSNDVSVLSAGISAVTQVVPSGATPVAVAGNSANSKIYVINQGDNTVTVISTIDNAVVKTIPVGSKPIWGVMSANAVDVFVVNQGDGTISVIDTTLDQVIPCTSGAFPGSCNATTGAISVGNAPATSSPNFAFFDTNRQRLYVTNTGEHTISVIKADGINLGVTPQVVPQLLANIPVSGAPVSVTALNDGSKVYAALANCPAGTNHTNLVAGATPQLPSCTGNLVSVIDATGLRETKTIQVGPGAVSVDSSGDALRAYVVSAFDTTTIEDNVHNPSCAPTGTCGVGGNCIVAPCVPGPILPSQTFTTPSVSIIRTSTDTVFTPPTDPSVISSPLPSFHVPAQDPKCTPAIDPNFNKTVPLPCAEQIPFMVRVFP
jgi:YVTN family beta-propeller protein